MGAYGGVEQALSVASGSFNSATAGPFILLRGNFNISVWGIFSGQLDLEKSFDGGSTWLNATFTDGSPISYAAEASASWSEPEQGVMFRFNCVEYVSGTIYWRLSLGNDDPGAPAANISDNSSPSLLSGILDPVAGRAALGVTPDGVTVLLNGGTISAPAQNMNLLGTINAATNDRSIAAGGTGGGAGARNAWQVGVAGSLSVDGIGTVVVNDYVYNTGSSWVRILGPSNVPVSNITSLTSIGFTSGAAISSGLGYISDWVDYVGDGAGNLIQAIDTYGTTWIWSGKSYSHNVVGMASAGTLMVTGSNATIVAGSTLMPDLVDYTSDGSGNIVEATDAAGAKHVQDLIVHGDLSVYGDTLNAGYIPGRVATVPSDALDITDYGADATGGNEGSFLGTWTNGGSVVVLEKYNGTITWDNGATLELTGLTADSGPGFTLGDVGSKVYVHATDASGVDQVGTITDWFGAGQVAITPTPTVAVASAKVVWPVPDSSNVGHLIAIDGGGVNLGNEAWDSGIHRWVGTIAAVNSNTITVTGAYQPTLTTTNAGFPTRAAWGNSDANATALDRVGEDLIALGKRRVWFPPIYGQGRTVYFAAALAYHPTWAQRYVLWSNSKDPTYAIQAATWVGDPSCVGAFFDATGTRMWKHLVPITAPAIPEPRRGVIGRAHLPRAKANATNSVTETGDSLSGYDPQGQIPIFSDVEAFEFQYLRDNPGKVVTYSNKTLGGGGWEDLSQSGSIAVWAVPGTDVFWLAMGGHNDFFRGHPVHVSMCLNAAASLSADGFGNKPDVLMENHVTKPQTPTGFGAWQYEACRHTAFLNRSVALTLGKGFVDLMSTSDLALNGADETHRQFASIPQTGTFNLTAANPFISYTHGLWNGGALTLTSSSGTQLWTDIGAMEISLSRVPGNVVRLDNDPNTGNVRLENRWWGRTVSATISTSGSVLTTAAGVTSTGTIVWTDWSTGLSMSTSPFTGTAGQALLVPGNALGGANQRTFIDSVVNSGTVVVTDMNWGIPAATVNFGGRTIVGSAEIGSLPFTAEDAAAGVNIVATWGTNEYRGTIVAFTDAHTVGVTPTPPALTNQAVSIWIGQTSGRVTTNQKGSTGGASQTIRWVIRDAEFILASTAAGVNWRGHVVRFGNEYYPRVSITGSGTIPALAATLFSDRPVHHMPVATLWDMWGYYGTSYNPNSPGGGSGGHMGSGMTERVTRRVFERQDFSAS